MNTTMKKAIVWALVICCFSTCVGCNQVTSTPDEEIVHESKPEYTSDESTTESAVKTIPDVETVTSAENSHEDANAEQAPPAETPVTETPPVETPFVQTPAPNETTVPTPEPPCQHISSDWIEDLAPSLSADGKRHKECTVCKAVLEFEGIVYELNALEPCYGFVSLQDHAGRYLYGNDRQFKVGTEQMEWNLMSCGADRFYLKDTDGFCVLEYYGGVLKMEEDTGYTEQQWVIKQNASGGIVIEHADEPNCFLRSDAEGRLSVVHRLAADEYCIWSMQELEITQGYPYIEVSGQSGTIVLRLEPRVLDIISQERLQKWANDLEQAYQSYIELTGWKPFDSVEIRGYTNCGSWGYVYANKPVVHVNKDELYKDLKKMSKRGNDWNFGVLHELSHLFDQDKWAFEWEVLANYKLAYALYKHGGFAAPAEFAASEVFSYATLRDGISQMGGSFANYRGTIGDPLTIRLWEITDIVGWPVVTKAFTDFPVTGEELSGTEKLELFLSLIQENSGEDTKAYFSAQEWELVETALQ